MKNQNIDVMKCQVGDLKKSMTLWNGLLSVVVVLILVTAAMVQ